MFLTCSSNGVESDHNAALAELESQTQLVVRTSGKFSTPWGEECLHNNVNQPLVSDLTASFEYWKPGFYVASMRTVKWFGVWQVGLALWLIDQSPDLHFVSNFLSFLRDLGDFVYRDRCARS